MHQFKQLLVALPHTLQQGNLEQTITELVFDSRKAKEGALFCCIVGTQTDGHQYAQQAYQQGCRVFVVQQTIDLPQDATIVKVTNTNFALAELACACRRYRNKWQNHHGHFTP
jgi:UDP-N-acetylmuramoyl-L-alanyl-D-glutamate--2,6-diaminopimelate ligase